MPLTLVIDGEIVNVISAYAPQVGLREEEKKAFWDSLDEVVRETPTDQRLMLGGDLNGHIGATTEGYLGAHGGFGYEVRNEEGEAYSFQHRLLAMDTLFKRVQRMRVRSAAPRILWKNLNGDVAEAFRPRVSKGVTTQIEAISASDADSMWNTLASIIKDASKDSFGVAIGTSKIYTTHRESWWPCEEVQSKVAEKQARFKELLSCREGNQKERPRAHERYKLAKREDKKAVTQAKEKAYKELYKKLDTKEGASDIFRIAKARQRRRRVLGDICFIKDEGEGREEVMDPNILPFFDYYYSRINQSEVKTTLQKMRRNKAVGPDQIPFEAWKILRGECISWLTSLFNKIFTSVRMPEEWGIKLLSHTMKLWERVIARRLRRETSVSENQFSFMPKRFSIEAIHLIRSLMEKFTERQRDLHLAFIDLEKAYDSIPHELIWKTLIDKGASRRYIKKSYDYRIKLLASLRGEMLVYLFFVLIVRNPFSSTSIGDENPIRTFKDYSKPSHEDYKNTIELPVGNNVLRDRNAKESWTLLEDLALYDNESWNDPRDFANSVKAITLPQDVPSTSDRRLIELENQVQRLMKAHLASTQPTQVNKITTSCENCSGPHDTQCCMEDPEQAFVEYASSHTDEARGSMMDKSRRIDEDVAHRIKAAWLKWRAATRVFCNKDVPLKLKGKFYRVAIRPATLYGSECWPITKALANRMEVAELRMLRWTCGKIMMDYNGVYKAELEVESIIKKMREGRLRWFGHVRRRPQSEPVRKVEAWVIDGLRRRGRPKLWWKDRLKLNIKELVLYEDMTFDRNECRARIRLGG
nr:hypothetical protein [Tanacetum cinerariifolium]